jgi:DNA-binding CsgD family transcriptional regulator
MWLRINKKPIKNFLKKLINLKKKIMNKTYPGMLDNSIEFFNFNEEIKFIQNGKISDFSELSFATLSIIKEEIDNDLEVKLALHDFFPDSEIRRTQKFVSCRFGGLDFQPDIKDGVLQDGEYWNCPNRGKCPHEGTLCKLPCINNQRLTDKEISIMQCSATDTKNNVIAENLGLPLGTFHLLKKNLYNKINVQTKQEVAQVSAFYNIL